jgi:hypothetical protein
METVSPDLFKVIYTLLLALLGWLLNNAWAEIKELKANQTTMKDDHHKFQLLVLQSFVKSDSFEKTEARIFQALDRIEHILSKKVDKSDL